MENVTIEVTLVKDMEHTCRALPGNGIGVYRTVRGRPTHDSGSRRREHEFVPTKPLVAVVRSSQPQGTSTASRPLKPHPAAPSGARRCVAGADRPERKIRQRPWLRAGKAGAVASPLR